MGYTYPASRIYHDSRDLCTCFLRESSKFIIVDCYNQRVKSILNTWTSRTKSQAIRSLPLKPTWQIWPGMQGYPLEWNPRMEELHSWTTWPERNPNPREGRQTSFFRKDPKEGRSAQFPVLHGQPDLLRYRDTSGAILGIEGNSPRDIFL